MNDFITIYKEAFKQLKRHFVKIIGWSAIWLIIPMAAFFWFMFMMFDFELMRETGIGMPASVYLVSTLMLFFALVSPLSLTHLGLSTAQNKDESFLSVGIFGILHPWRSFCFNFAWVVVYFVLWLIMTFLWYFLWILAFLIGLLPFLTSFGLFILYIYSANNVISFDEGTFDAIGRARNQLRGWFLHAVVLLLPYMIVFSILFCSAFGVLIWSNQTAFIETDLAKEGLQIVPETLDENDEFANLLKLTTFHEEPPEYDGDFELYKQQLAEYKVSYETFLANKNKTEVPPLVQRYIDLNDDVQATGHYKFYFFLIMLGMIALFAYGLCIFTQLYRTTTGELDAEKNREKEGSNRVELAHNHLISRANPQSLPAPELSLSSNQSVSPDELLHSTPVTNTQSVTPNKVSLSKTTDNNSSLTDGSPESALNTNDSINPETGRADAIDPGFELKF